MSGPGSQLALPLFNRVESVVELALGFTRQIPGSYLAEEEAKAILTAEGNVGIRRAEVVKALKDLRFALIRLDTSLGFDPLKHEVAVPSSSTTSKEK